jgi:cell division protein FtsN
MSQNPGEKELILGNKQLISLFFIVVALCGVFFAMGYMVRGNSIKGAVSTTGDTAANNPDAEIKRQQPEPPRETTAAPPADPTPLPTTETHPADDTPPAPAGASVDPGAALKADVKPTPAPPKTEVADSDTRYIQVSALGKTDAENMVRTLREQHFPASISPSSKENLYRVLVGPYHQTADVADAKSRLKTLGFSNTIVQKQ